MIIRITLRAKKNKKKWRKNNNILTDTVLQAVSKERYLIMISVYDKIQENNRKRGIINDFPNS